MVSDEELAALYGAIGQNAARALPVEPPPTSDPSDVSSVE